MEWRKATYVTGSYPEDKRQVFETSIQEHNGNRFVPTDGSDFGFLGKLGNKCVTTLFLSEDDANMFCEKLTRAGLTFYRGAPAKVAGIQP